MYEDGSDDEDDEDNVKRMKAAMVGVLFPAILGSSKQFSVLGKHANVVRDRTALVAKIKALRESGKFKRMYRLHEYDFDRVVSLITPIMQKRVLSTSVPVIVKLAVTLRFLAGGIYLDLCFGYDLDENNIHALIFDTLTAIDECTDPWLDNIVFPASKEGLERLEAGFNKLSRFRFRGTVAAGDGVVFRMHKPLTEQVDGDVVSWYTRKGYYAYGLQAFCDSMCKFLFISSKLCSSCHDSAMYAVSALSIFIKSGKLLPGYHVVLDDAYPCHMQELSPHKGKQLSVEKDAFNYYLSLHRQCIERAFGLLVQRWGIFWRPLRVSMEHRAMVVRVCCKLHNICIDRFGLDNPTV
jgi:DDE superfamily endonuclease